MSSQSAQRVVQHVGIAPVATPQTAVMRAMRIGDLVVRETLTPIMVLDLVAHGDLGLVERALSSITGFDERTVNALLLDRGWMGLRSLYRAAGFDLALLPAVHTALAALNEAGGSVAPAERKRHAERCLSRFLTSADHLSAEELDDVLELFHETEHAVLPGRV